MTELVSGVYRDGNGRSQEVVLACDADGRLLVSGGGGGGGGGSTSPADIANGIDQSTDINIFINSLSTSIKSAAIPQAQVTLAIAPGAVGTYVIPDNCRCLAICINSGSLVYYTEDGSVPTNTSCWFGGGTKEVWESNIPVGATLTMLAVSATTISIQPRV